MREHRPGIPRAVAALALLGALLGACAGAPTRVVLIGDSITHGVVAGGGPPFAERLAGRLGEGYEVVNLGCGGTTSLDWRPGAAPAPGCSAERALYVERAAPALPARIAVVLLGTNDALGFRAPFPTPPEAYRRALHELVAALREDGAGTVLLMTPPPPPPAAMGATPWMLRNLHRYRKQVIALCGSAPGAARGPDLFVRLEPRIHLEGGDVHPNALGHEAIAEALAARIEEIAR